MKRIAIIAGEASGDLLAARLILALRQRCPALQFEGIAGVEMQAAGCHSLFPLEKLSVMGLVEVLVHLPELLSIRKQLFERWRDNPPDLFIGVDAPDFNLPLAAKLHAIGIPTVHYVSPSVWAWRAKRVRKMRGNIDLMLTLFPFEVDFYHEHGITAEFVGHPLADEIEPQIDRQRVRQSLNLPEAAPLITLMPGSRQSELAFHAQLFVEAANQVATELPEALFLVPLTTKETRALFEAALKSHADKSLRVRILFGHARDALAASDLALVCSGTATLEAALLRCPMIITYRLSAFSAWVYKKLRYLTWVGLPNILLGRLVVPELLQDDATPEKLSAALIALWRNPHRRQEMEASFAAIHQKLRQNSAERAADAVVACVASHSS